MSENFSTPKLKKLFIKYLRDEGATATTTGICEKLGIPRRTVYNWRHKSKKFKEQWDRAIADRALERIDIINDVNFGKSAEGDYQHTKLFYDRHGMLKSTSDKIVHLRETPRKLSKDEAVSAAEAFEEEY